MRVLVKNKETGTYVAVETNRIEYDKETESVVMSTDSGSIILENIKEGEAENLIGSVVHNGYVVAAKYDATFEAADDIDWDENSDILDM